MGTNPARRHREDTQPPPRRPSHKTNRPLHHRHRPFRRPGGHSEGSAPDPIPNSAVKTLRANGTPSQDAGEYVAARSSERTIQIQTRDAKHATQDANQHTKT